MSARPTRDLIGALKAIRDESAKNKPNPDKIFAIAQQAISDFESATDQQPS
jgi:hypothetical protein